MTKDAAERVYKKVQALSLAGVSLSDKDVDVLGKILGSEPMLKALAVLYSQANAAPSDLLRMNLDDPQQRHDATLLQGAIAGLVNGIEALFALATDKSPEDEDDDVSTQQ